MSADGGGVTGPRTLAWDSSFLGVSVGMIEAGADCSAGDLKAALGGEEARSFDLLVVTHAGGPARLRPVLEREGALLVDTKLDYAMAVRPLAPGARDLERIGAAVNAPDGAALEGLALESGRFSRFRIDPNIGEARWAELYRLWVRNSLSGEVADAVFVGRRAGTITGFVTVKRQDSGRARIGLIGVDAAERGMGVGSELVAAARHWAASQALTELWVATQQANDAANRFYESRGFTLMSKTDIYHLWATR